MLLFNEYDTMSMQISCSHDIFAPKWVMPPATTVMSISDNDKKNTMNIRYMYKIIILMMIKVKINKPFWDAKRSLEISLCLSDLTVCSLIDHRSSEHLFPYCAEAARPLYMTELNLWFNEMFISAENFHFYGTRLNNATAYRDRLHTIRGPGKYSDLSFVLKGLLKRSIKSILLAPALTNR